METDEFEKLVIEAVESLPEFFKDKMDNVDLVVEDWPAAEFSRGRLLLGLYQGVPLPARGRGYSLVIPDKITIFQGPIMLVSGGHKDAIKKVVADTVKHEIAHHFGISDARLAEIEKNKR